MILGKKLVSVASQGVPRYQKHFLVFDVGLGRQCCQVIFNPLPCDVHLYHTCPHFLFFYLCQFDVEFSDQEVRDDFVHHVIPKQTKINLKALDTIGNYSKSLLS